MVVCCAHGSVKDFVTSAAAFIGMMKCTLTVNLTESQWILKKYHRSVETISNIIVG